MNTGFRECIGLGWRHARDAARPPALRRYNLYKVLNVPDTGISALKGDTYDLEKPIAKRLAALVARG